MTLPTLPTLARRLLLATAVVATLTPVSLATAEAASPPSHTKSGNHPAARNPVSRAEAFFTCAQDQQRSDRVQRIKQSIKEQLATMQSSENAAATANKPDVVAYWKFAITERQRYEKYIVRYWHSDYDKQKKYEISILNLHKKGATVTRGEARLKACKLNKLTFPPPKAVPPPTTAPPTTIPSATKAPSTTKPSESATTTTTPPPTSTTTPPSTTTTTPPSTTTPSTTTTTPGAKTATPSGSAPTTSSTGPATPGA